MGIMIRYNSLYLRSLGVTMSDLVKKTVTIQDQREIIRIEGRTVKKNKNLKLNIAGSGSSSGTPIFCSYSSDSWSAIEDLIQCGICLERLHQPRMLPCQHTFCLSCLKAHITAKNLKFQKRELVLNDTVKSMACPVCQKQMALDDGMTTVDRLPRNLYLQSILKVLTDGTPTSPTVRENYRCVNCQTVSAQQEQVCQHCMQIFCTICWNAHLTELDSNLTMLTKQLEESEVRLTSKLENFEARCDTLAKEVKKTTAKRVESIMTEEQNVLLDLCSIKKESAVASDILLDSMCRLRKDIMVKAMDKNNNQKVNMYLNLHRETSKLLDQVNYFGEARLTFDPESYKLDQISEGIYNDEDNNQNQASSPIKVGNPCDSAETMAKQYRGRSFTPKLVWNKCPSPGGLGIPPWDNTKLYIATTFKRNVLILDRSKLKLIDRLTHETMSCPAGIAFSKSRKEVFITDKWQNCVHVFSHEGDFLRTICTNKFKLKCPDGIAMGPNEELIICDTANNRVVLADQITGDKIKIIGFENEVTQLNYPTGVAVFGNNIIVADSGNNRVKTFNLNGQLVHEIGSYGKNPGQFRSAEVVAVDQFGFILVGDAGNARSGNPAIVFRGGEGKKENIINFIKFPFKGSSFYTGRRPGEDLRKQKRFQLGVRSPGHSRFANNRRRQQEQMPQDLLMETTVFLI
ncbi:uncharacterized protein LOC126736108 isoform X2 [Anthonomus grandis grandis]|uniref:uncharacterized protein LOC126736108 isoform X2 n=1 Tax=Anthonomus grandis grandis TaxID=2921223 RepID=UPI0021667DDE|nr:uncharacterized protein LOC126736108 isoform X2 [Anthonomus grandis grandis]